MIKLHDKVNDTVLISNGEHCYLFCLVVSLILGDTLKHIAELIEVGIRVVAFKAYPAHIAVSYVKIITVNVFFVCLKPPFVFKLVTLRCTDNYFESIPTRRSKHHVHVGAFLEPVSFCCQSFLIRILIKI